MKKSANDDQNYDVFVMLGFKLKSTDYFRVSNFSYQIIIIECLAWTKRHNCKYVLLKSKYITRQFANNLRDRNNCGKYGNFCKIRCLCWSLSLEKKYCKKIEGFYYS